MSRGSKGLVVRATVSPDVGLERLTGGETSARSGTVGGGSCLLDICGPTTHSPVGGQREGKEGRKGEGWSGEGWARGKIKRTDFGRCLWWCGPFSIYLFSFCWS